MGQYVFWGLCIFFTSVGFATDRDSLVWSFQTLEYQAQVVNIQSQSILEYKDFSQVNDLVVAMDKKSSAIHMMKNVFLNQLLSENLSKKDPKLEMKLDKIHKVLLSLSYLEKNNDLRMIQSMINDLQILKRWYLPPKPYEKVDVYPKQHRSYPRTSGLKH